MSSKNIIKLYEGYIELHANHTMWKIDSDNPETEYEYNVVLYFVIQEFKRITGQEVYLLGRNARHICVENTYHNRQQFINLQRCAKRLEKLLISNVNIIIRIGEK